MDCIAAGQVLLSHTHAGDCGRSRGKFHLYDFTAECVSGQHKVVISIRSLW